MNVSRQNLVSSAVFVLMFGAALSAATSARAACEPVACPAIGKICSDGQLACRVSPCNCALVCSSGRGCDDGSEPLGIESGTLEGQGSQLEAQALLMTPAGPEAPVEPGAAPGQFCGGIAGIECPDGFVCVDVKGDGCNPDDGGADCPGRCKRIRN